MTVDPPAASVVFAGLRETGKTTFLVALWHTVLNNQVPGALSLERFYEGDREYINARYAEWLEYEAVKRTLVDHSTPILMTLRDHDRGAILQLGIPDLSGETFKAQFEDRRATAGFASAIRGATGIAIFINPDRVSDPTKIRDAWGALDEEDEGDEAGDPSEQEPAPETAPDGITKGESAERPPETAEAAEEIERAGRAEDESEAAGQPRSRQRKEPREFESALCCTQVKYVDLLQQFVEYGAPMPLRCAVIISAIDTLDGTPFEDRPEEFLRVRMSLLDQFLRTRRDLFHARIYGVSAQGGKYDAASVESLARLGPRRIRVCSGGARGSDISRPVRWLAFGEE